jgi:hypothetical protein
MKTFKDTLKSIVGYIMVVICGAILGIACLICFTFTGLLGLKTFSKYIKAVQKNCHDQYIKDNSL